MKKNIKILLVLAFVFVNSCEENFSIKDDYTEEYILNCIIQGNSEFQTAAILRSFNVEGFNPESDSSNPFVSGAKITLQYNDTTYEFRDTVMASLVEQRFNGSLKLYYVDNFKSHIVNRDMQIKAELPNGQVLTAESNLPIEFALDFRQDGATYYIPPRDPKVSNINIFWQAVDVTYYQYYLPKLRIDYEYEKNRTKIKKFVEVPFNKDTLDQVEYFYYPKPSRAFSISYPMVMIDRAMKKIMEDENITDPSKITVNRWASIKVLAMNDKLAGYYFAGLSENPYTIRIDNITYSNINGGFGIFGSSWIEETRLRIADDYINSFGYNVIN